jgi:hypothetical protein
MNHIDFYPASFTLSPFFVSKSNERSGFIDKDFEYGPNEVEHLPLYWDYFAWRKREFWSRFKESAQALKTDVHSAWYDLLSQKHKEENLTTWGYDIPVEGVCYQIWRGKFKEKQHEPVKPVEFHEIVPSGVNASLNEFPNYKEYLQNLYTDYEV